MHSNYLRFAAAPDPAKKENDVVSSAKRASENNSAGLSTVFALNCVQGFYILVDEVKRTGESKRLVVHALSSIKFSGTYATQRTCIAGIKRREQGNCQVGAVLK